MLRTRKQRGSAELHVSDIKIKRSMELAITIVEISLYLSIFVFPVTLLILIKTVKQQNLDLVKSAITNPFFPNIDLRFFENLRQEYYRISVSATIKPEKQGCFKVTLPSSKRRRNHGAQEAV